MLKAPRQVAKDLTRINRRLFLIWNPSVNLWELWVKRYDSLPESSSAEEMMARNGERAALGYPLDYGLAARLGPDARGLALGRAALAMARELDPNRNDIDPRVIQRQTEEATRKHEEWRRLQVQDQVAEQGRRMTRHMKDEFEGGGFASVPADLK